MVATKPNKALLKPLGLQNGLLWEVWVSGWGWGWGWGGGSRGRMIQGTMEYSLVPIMFLDLRDSFRKVLVLKPPFLISNIPPYIV